MDSRWERGWRCGEFPHLPEIHSHPTVDISHLVSMLTAGLRMGAPHTNTFGGDAIPGKMEVSFEQWYYKVQSVKNHYKEVVS